MSEYRKNITSEAMEDEFADNKKPQYRKAFDAKNYLNVKLADGENEKTLRIRLLPVDKDANSPFKTIHMHQMKVAPELSASGWKSYVCLNKTDDIDHDTYGTKCPFCEMNHDAFEHMKEWDEKYKAAKKANDEEEMTKCAVERDRWKAISLANKEQEVCIVRCIERGHEEDGPKFWKFNVRSDGKDPKSIIKTLWRDRKQESIEEALEEYEVDKVEELPDEFEPVNILDLETGRDLKVTIERVFDKEGKPTKKTSVSIVDYGKNRPVSRDEDEVDAWVNDEKVWSDVFVVKPYEYLSIILDGEVPFYDKENKTWRSKGRVRDEETKKQIRDEKSAEDKIRSAKEKALEYEDDEEEVEDLPD